MKKLAINLFIIALAYLFTYGIVYKALENPTIYNKLFSSFMPTYVNTGSSIDLASKPFNKITNEGYEVMDAAHYAYIKNNLYTINPNDIESNYNFGFFPLFPIIWKFFSDFGITILNYFWHFASIIILAFVFCRNKTVLAVITVLALPTLTVFLLPYTEALFMFSISIAILGYSRKNIYLYSIGLMMASATRPVFLLFVLALIATEVYQYLRIKKVDKKHLITSSAIVIFVTFFISFVQAFYHHSSLFTFMTVQEHWGTFFRMPDTINDWSMEGYGMNVWALVFCFVFGITILISALLNKSKQESEYDYWYYFSWIYLIATCVYVLLFQGGCLHSLYRYTLCSPFFYVILFSHINTIETLSIRNSMILTGCFIVASLLFLHFAPYAHAWGFHKLGFVLLILNLLYFVCNSRLNIKLKYSGYLILILSGILWNCYLYNMFFSKAWIFL